MGKNKLTTDKNQKLRWIPLVSIGVVALFLFFAGCLDNEAGDEDDNVEMKPGALLNLTRESYGISDDIELGVRNTGNTNLMFGRSFSVDLFNKSSSEWEAVGMDLIVTMDMIILSPGDVFTQSFNPEEVFVDEVKEGQYRIRKTVSVDDTGESMELEKVFRIEADTE